MKNPKHINHWIAEVRRLAARHKPRLRKELAQGEFETLTKTDIRSIFCIASLHESYKDELTPQEALEAELECWE